MKRSNAQHATREDWLNAAVDHIRAWIGQCAPEADLPQHIHALTGWTSKGSGRTNTLLGQCDYSTADGHPTIFIAPHRDDELEILGTLLHEVVHTALPGAGHNKTFSKLARTVGLQGKPSHCDLPGNNGNPPEPGAPVMVWAKSTLDALGPYPHSPVNAGMEGKKQGTRMGLCRCDACGYQVRTTRKWLEVARPTCPNPTCERVGEPMSCRGADEDPEADGGE